MDIYDFDNYIFDCDGVILDSNRIKSNAFMQTVLDFEKKYQDEFYSYLLGNGGVTRDKKYWHFFKNIVKVTDSEEIERLTLLYVKKFADLVLIELCDSSFTEGVLTFLKELNHRNKSIYIWTGGSKSETIEVMNKKGVLNLFKSVYGAPGSKIETLEILMAENDVDSSDTLVIGDSLTDQSCAKDKKLKFLFVDGYTDACVDSLNKIKNFEFSNLEIL